MAENSENIEAKLCAYVEGDLDEEGRAEIERHLDAHPNHRRLLAELASTRDLLRYLPRETAPADLAETFNAQLERSALLDGPSTDPAAPQIHAGNLLPRLLALAAIVVLGAGLGAVVYFGLPRGTSNTNYARVSPRPEGATTEEMAAVAPSADSATRPVAEHAERMAKAGAGGGGWAGETPAGAVADNRRAMKNGKGGAGPALADSVAAKPGAFGGQSAGGEVADDRVYLFVCATDLSAATREVTEKLAASNIAWQPADASAQIAQQQQLPNQAVSNTNASLVFSDPARIELDNALKKKQFLQSQAPEQQRQYAGQSIAVTQPVDGYEAKRTLAGDYDKVISGKDANEPVAVASPPPAAAAPAPSVPGAPATPTAPAHALERANDTAADQLQQAQQQQQKEQIQPSQQPEIHPLQQTAVAQVQRGAQGVSAGDVVGYRAKMTREQVLSLSSSLNRPAQQVELIADDQKLRNANALLQAGQQQFARHVRDEAPPADRSSVPEATNELAVATPAPAPVTQPVDQPQRQRLAQIDAAVSSPPPGDSNAAADAAKSDAAAPAERPRGAYAMKVGPDSKAVQSPAKAESQQPAAAAAAQPSAPAPSAPSAVAPTLSKHSPIAARAGGERRAQLLEKIAPRARLRVTVDELAGPDMSPSCEADVAADGTIGLPKLAQRIRVEGLTRAQAELAIHDAYKSASVVDEPTVTVEPIPATAPLAQGGRQPVADVAGGVAQQAPARAPLPAQPAAQSVGQSTTTVAGAGTQPTVSDQDGQRFQAATAAPTSGPAPAADEALDVVILVQRSPGASTEPATFDAAAPPVAEPSSTEVPEAAKPAAPAAPAEPAAPNTAAPSVPDTAAPPAPEAPETPAPTPPSTPSDVQAK